MISGQQTRGMLHEIDYVPYRMQLKLSPTYQQFWKISFQESGITALRSKLPQVGLEVFEGVKRHMMGLYRGSLSIGQGRQQGVGHQTYRQ